MKEPSDEELVVQVKKGQIGAFEILVRRYQQKLLNYVGRILADEVAAEEVVQDSLFAVYRAIDRLDPTKKFSAYIWAVARNTAISYLRRRRIDLPLAEGQEIESEVKLEEELMRHEESQRLRQKLASLPKGYRQVLELYYFEDLSYEQISRKLKLPLNTVRTRLRRAKQRVAKIYEKD